MATSSSTNNQDFSVVNPKFCINSTTKFAVRKQPPVLSIVGDRWIIQDRAKNTGQGEKFKLEELALKEPGLALKDSDGKLILTVKPEDSVVALLRDKKQWNVFRTMEGKKVPLFTVVTSGDYSEIEVPRTDYKIEGSFKESIFTISHNSRGVAAKVLLKYKVDDIKIDSVQNNQVEDKKIHSVYDVDVEPGYDQAFIFGLVAVFEQIRKRLTKK